MIGLGLRSWVLSGIVFAFLALSCGNGGRVEQERIPRVVRVAVVQGEIAERSVRSSGTVSFEKKIDVSASVEGMLSLRPAKEGDFVGKDAILAVLSNVQVKLARDRAMSARDQAKTALSLAEAKLIEGRLSVESRFAAIDRALIDVEKARRGIAETERKLKDQRALYAAGGVAEESVRQLKLALDDAVTNLAIAERELELKRIGFRESDLKAFALCVPRSATALREAYVALNTVSLSAERDVQVSRVASAGMELASAEESLKELTLRAPDSGIVGAVNFEVGERVKGGDKVFTLMRTGTVYAVFPVREDEAAFLGKGDTVSVTVEAVRNEPFEAVIDVVSPAADPSVGAFTAKALMQNPDGSLKPGMFARVTAVSAKPETVLFAPRSAIFGAKQGEGYAFAIVSGKAIKRKVTVGMEKDDKTEICTGAKEGDVLILDPDPALLSGDTVEIGK